MQSYFDIYANNLTSITLIMNFQVIVNLFQKLTEGRVPACTHEVVPDHLRTKPEPEVEEKINQLNVRAQQAENLQVKNLSNFPCLLFREGINKLSNYDFCHLKYLW